MPSILIVEDDHSLSQMLSLHFEEQHFKVETACDCASAMTAVKQSSPDLILLDQQLPDGLGSELIAPIHAISPVSRIIMMTGVHDLELAIQSIQNGATDFIHKPIKTQVLQTAIDKALAYQPAPEQTQAAEPAQIRGLIGRSDAMLEVSKNIALSAQSNATVLINGESGTGKEIVAHLIHQYSKRTGPMIAVNCAAIVDSLLETELFGHQKGAFTGATENKAGRFQQAHDGTLFLDEIGELALHLQAKLLRALQEQMVEPVGSHESVPVNARIIAATHKNLFAEAEAGRFREDLAYRLDVIHIDLPALRERKDDIPLLATALIERAAQKTGCSIAPITPEAMQKLVDYHWPGNVRELENTLTQALIQARDGTISAGLIRFHGESNTATGITYTHHMPPTLSLAQIEAQYVQQVLNHTNGHKGRACAILDISRPALDRKIKKYCLSLP